MLSLAVFAWLLTLVDSSAAGRAYAAYGGIYICASLAGSGGSNASGLTPGICWVQVRAWLELRSYS